MKAGALLAIRTDASFEIGTGHVMRCLTLAESARDRAAQVVFVCRAQPGDLCGLIESRGFAVQRLRGEDAGPAADAGQTARAIESLGAVPDWLIVDHYALDGKWEAALRPAAARLMVIDDLANRHHDCDLILDQNYCENFADRYEKLVPERCARAVGPRFALLRREFVEASRALEPHDGKLNTVLVAFGGSDSTDETGKTLEALRHPALREMRLEVVVGSLNRRKEELSARYGSSERISFHVSATNLAELMSGADLAIGAGGTMNLERCCLGLPAIVIVTAPNQAESSGALGNACAIVNLGWHADVTSEHVASAVRSLAADGTALRALSLRCREVMDAGASNPAGVDILSTLTGHPT